MLAVARSSSVHMSIKESSVETEGRIELVFGHGGFLQPVLPTACYRKIWVYLQ